MRTRRRWIPELWLALWVTCLLIGGCERDRGSQPVAAPQKKTQPQAKKPKPPQPCELLRRLGELDKRLATKPAIKPQLEALARDVARLKPQSSDGRALLGGYRLAESVGRASSAPATCQGLEQVARSAETRYQSLLQSMNRRGHGSSGLRRRFAEYGFIEEHLRALRVRAYRAGLPGPTARLLREIAKRQWKAVPGLLRAKADANAKDFHGSPVLHRALRAEQTEAVVALIEAGADVNARDRESLTPLMLACSKQHANLERAKIIRLLLKKGAKRAAVDKTRKTAHAYAVEAKLPAKLLKRLAPRERR